MTPERIAGRASQDHDLACIRTEWEATGVVDQAAFVDAIEIAVARNDGSRLLEIMRVPEWCSFAATAALCGLRQAIFFGAEA